MHKPQLRQWLHRRAANHQQNFALLVTGFGLFAFGLAAVGFGQYGFGPGLMGEMVALGGLILIGAGIILAAIGYLSLSVLRILSLLDDSNDGTTPPRH